MKEIYEKFKKYFAVGCIFEGLSDRNIKER